MHGEGRVGVWTFTFTHLGIVYVIFYSVGMISTFIHNYFFGEEETFVFLKAWFNFKEGFIGLRNSKI